VSTSAAVLNSTTTSPRALFPHRQAPARHLGHPSHYFYSLIARLLLFSSPFFTTSFSPIRISGHILCSFSQVRPHTTPHIHAHASDADVCCSFGVTTSTAHCKSLTFTTLVSCSSPAPLVPLTSITPTSPSASGLWQGVMSSPSSLTNLPLGSSLAL
jgi:hypothetical protein